jgi:uracil-DNA glycosylase
MNIKPLGSISKFVAQLATACPREGVGAVSTPTCTNPYEWERPFAKERRHNLRLYLQWMAQQNPQHLLIGEAPGYRGCRLTGIPFVSPFILAGLEERLVSGYQFSVINGLASETERSFQAITEWPHIQREASATLVWRTIGQWQPLPLLWNIFPFHPHKQDTPQSNRTPTAKEVAAGRPFLQSLLQLFPQIALIAVGKKAATALTKWDFEHTAVRHPSHGGAKQFQAALTEQILGR